MIYKVTPMVVQRHQDSSTIIQGLLPEDGRLPPRLLSAKEHHGS